eukprot:TRINITY_DN159_c0_g1_i5.p1 TRINITY_DN159_c0_g1~~TRINITY_DN159_c0_g1_i5.p1  ORF type:complete len:445 (-),score=132.05 TRINITY_DN159_c0_g1_i5:88-1317(-)
MPQFSSASEKCHECTKTVYLTEKIVIEDKEDRRTYHKACLKCSHCKKVLSLGNYASMGGVYYCKPHFKQLFATKGNYDEGFGKEQHKTKWAPSAAPAAPSAGSFVPVESTYTSSSSSTSSTSPSVEKEVKSPAPVVKEEPTPPPAPAPSPSRAHVSSPAPTPAPAAEERTFKKPAAYSRPGQSFIPVESAAASASKKDTPTGIASRFKSQSEKCVGCSKTVYATEKIVVEDKADKSVFHKTCLKCVHCAKVLSLGNYAGMGGKFYCKPHFKQLFATKGNYDEGFGREQHKTKWAAGEGESSTAISSSPSTEDIKHHVEEPVHHEEAPKHHEPEPVPEPVHEEREATSPVPVEETREEEEPRHEAEPEPVHEEREAEPEREAEAEVETSHETAPEVEEESPRDHSDSEEN